VGVSAKGPSSTHDGIEGSLDHATYCVQDASSSEL